MFFLNFGKPLPFPLDGPVLSPLLPECKLVSTPGAGYDRVDVKVLSAAGTMLANNPVTVRDRTADSTACMILQALRGTVEHDRNVREGKWVDRNLLCKDARTSTLGIVGMGAIGQKGAFLAPRQGARSTLTASPDTPTPPSTPRSC